MHEARDTKARLEAALALKIELLASAKEKMISMEQAYKSQIDALNEALAKAEEKYNALTAEFDNQASEFESERDTLESQLEDRQLQIKQL